MTEFLIFSGRNSVKNRGFPKNPVFEKIPSRLPDKAAALNFIDILHKNRHFPCHAETIC